MWPLAEAALSPRSVHKTPSAGVALSLRSVYKTWPSDVALDGGSPLPTLSPQDVALSLRSVHKTWPSDVALGGAAPRREFPPFADTSGVVTDTLLTAGVKDVQCW